MGLIAPTDCSAIQGALRTWKIVPSGDACLIVEIANRFSLEANQHAAALARRIERRCALGKLQGIVDIVPGMTTVGVHYRPEAVRCHTGELPYASLTRQLEDVLDDIDTARAGQDVREVEIPVCYGAHYGPDLDAVARACGLTSDDVIACHTAAPVDVLMLGFAPGHAYVGEFDARLSIPRRGTPRTRVPKGSIGLANRQTVIYPNELPGGWNLIGRTPLTLFRLDEATPCLLRPGDRVRFVPIDAETFLALEARQP